MIVVSGVLYYCLYESTALPLVLLIFPLVLYDRSFMFPMFLTITLCQGAFNTAQVSGAGPTQDASYAETYAIMAVTPMLLYDLLTQKSKMIPFRFVLFYIIFVLFVIQGAFIYYQHPENYQGLAVVSAKFTPIIHSITKAIKICFYVFYLKVLINYPVSQNVKTLEITRRFMPFVIIVIAANLLINGRVQNGAGYTGSLQLGDAHHGSFTSQLCSIGIYLYITIFSRKVNLITRLFALSALVGIGTTIMLMGSRNGLLSFFILFCLGLYVNLKGRRIDFQVIILIAAFVAGVATILVSLNSPTVQRAIYMTEVESGGDRVYYWEAGAKAIQKFPIFGLGGDESASQGAVARYAPAVVEDKVMHNTYLEVAVEYGLFALIFYLALLFFVLKWGYRLFKFALQKQTVLLAAPAVSYLILMIAAMFISDIWDTAIWYNMSLVFALSIQLLYYRYISKPKVDTFSSLQQQLAQGHATRRSRTPRATLQI